MLARGTKKGSTVRTMTTTKTKSLTAHLYQPATIKIAPGTRGTYSGFPASVVRHYDGNTYEIRVPGGITAVCISGFIPENPTPEFTAQVAAYRKLCLRAS